MKILALLSVVALSACAAPRAIPVPEVAPIEAKQAGGWDYPDWN